MKSKVEPTTLARLKELLRYEPDEGSFYWRVTRQRSPYYATAEEAGQVYLAAKRKFHTGCTI